MPAVQAPNIHIVHGSVQDVNCKSKIATVATHEGGVSKLGYDFLVVASGLRRVWPVIPQSLKKKQYLLEVGDHIRSVANFKHGVAVVGGGESDSCLPPRLFLSRKSYLT